MPGPAESSSLAWIFLRTLSVSLSAQITRTELDGCFLCVYDGAQETSANGVNQLRYQFRQKGASVKKHRSSCDWYKKKNPSCYGPLGPHCHHNSSSWRDDKGCSKDDFSWHQGCLELIKTHNYAAPFISQGQPSDNGRNSAAPKPASISDNIVFTISFSHFLTINVLLQWTWQ